MNALLVPTLGLDLTLLNRLAESIDHPIRHKVLIHNGRFGDLDQWITAHPEWILLCRGGNLGVAASWNLGAELFPDEKAWLICNDDIWFPPGILRQFCEFGDARCESREALRLNDSSPYYCFIHTRKNIEDFGTFDENFWPAYYEDCDYNVRIRRSGGTMRNCFPGQNQVNHGKPRCGGMDYNAMLQGAGLFNRRYWTQKWGSDDRELGEFVTPFNNPKSSIKDWELDRERRSQMYSLWLEFMATEHPSIYD